MTRPSKGEIDVARELKGSKGSSLLAIGTRFMNRLNEWIVRAATVAMLAASLVLTLGVLLRYFLKIPTDWQDETAVFLIVGAIFMCGAYVQSYRRHVGIEVLGSILPDGVNRARLVLVDTCSFLFCAFFSWKSWALLHEAISEGQTTSSSFGPPLWIPYGLMAAGMTLLSLQILLQVPTHFIEKKEAT
jgi:TRAP-type C4-dicarboxylate transport system permease small subunit